MDPLSVSASVVGLLAAGAKITSFLVSFARTVHEAPSLAKALLQEINEIERALQSLQLFIIGQVQSPEARQSLIQLEHVLTTLTGCVATYSDLQKIVDELNMEDDMNFIDKVKWSRQESKIGVYVQRLQSHKLSLTFMLAILQCHTNQEAVNSNRRLCALIEESLKNNQDLAKRIKSLEREGSIVAETSSRIDDTSTIRSRRRDSKRLSFIENTKFALSFSFDQDLQSSRVYNRAAKRESMMSLTSSAIHTTALSLFSNLSLSQVSNISFYALPIYTVDLSNSACYVFGEEGAMAATSSHTVSNDQSEHRASSRPSTEDSLAPLRSAQQSAVPTRLLGRFARKKRVPSAPENPVHMIHVGYDNKTGRYTGLPKEWDNIQEEAPAIEPGFTMDTPSSGLDQPTWETSRGFSKYYKASGTSQSTWFEHPRSPPPKPGIEPQSGLLLQNHRQTLPNPTPPSAFSSNELISNMTQSDKESMAAFGEIVIQYEP